MRAHTTPAKASAHSRARARAATRTTPVVGFVGLQKPPPAAAAREQERRTLEGKAASYFTALNARDLKSFGDLVAEDATHHDDGMWLLQPAKGRTAITHLQRDLLRCIPDYSIAVVSVSTEPASRDAFVLWHASGTAKLSVIPQRATTGRPFEHAGVTRLHFDADGRIQQLWTWRGPTADEAHWLLTRRGKPVDLEAFLDHPAFPATTNSTSSRGPASTSGAPAGAGAGAARCDDTAAGRAKGAALAYRDAFGATGAGVQQLAAVLTEDYVAKEATGVWRAGNLDSKAACLDFCLARQEQLAGSPHWHSEALSPDGRLLFVHFQNVLMARDSGNLVGLSSGILVHCFDDQQRIRRTLKFRGPTSLAERAQFFPMDGGACGREKADSLAVDGALFAGGL